MRAGASIDAPLVMEFSEGSIVAGRYRLLSKLGEGGMGCVWRAQDGNLEKPVAIKLLTPHESAAHNAEATARFEREARAVASLVTRHVAHVSDFGIDGEHPYIVMELLEGETLERRLGRLPAITPLEFVDILRQVGKALSEAHGKGIVHRDLKPANIFLAQDPDTGGLLVKVLDFGVAKAEVGTEGARSDLTKTGFQPGTPIYMSPEQFLGRGTTDLHTDIWAMGVIAFESLVGEHPFAGQFLERLGLAICSDPLPIPSTFRKGLPEGFDAWFAQAANRDPTGRFSSAEAAIAALQYVCGISTSPGQRSLASVGALGTACGFVDSARRKPRSDTSSLPPGAAEARCSTELEEPVERADRPALARPGVIQGLGPAAPTEPGVSSDDAARFLVTRDVEGVAPKSASGTFEGAERSSASVSRRPLWHVWAALGLGGIMLATALILASARVPEARPVARDLPLRTGATEPRHTPSSMPLSAGETSPAPAPHADARPAVASTREPEGTQGAKSSEANQGRTAATGARPSLPPARSRSDQALITAMRRVDQRYLERTTRTEATGTPLAAAESRAVPASVGSASRGAP